MQAERTCWRVLGAGQMQQEKWQRQVAAEAAHEVPGRGGNEDGHGGRGQKEHGQARGGRLPQAEAGVWQVE